jgi:hypothetical protein
MQGTKNKKDNSQKEKIKNLQNKSGETENQNPVFLSGDSSVESAPFNIRWIAFGTLLIFLTVFSAEKLIWKLIQSEPETVVFIKHAIEKAQNPDITSEQKSQLRSEVLERLNRKDVIAIAAAVIISPFIIGFFIVLNTKYIRNGAMSAFLGVVAIMLILAQKISIGLITGSLLFAGAGAIGGLLAKKINS